jgi:hypothetical protein
MDKKWGGGGVMEGPVHSICQLSTHHSANLLNTPKSKYCICSFISLASITCLPQLFPWSAHLLKVLILLVVLVTYCAVRYACCIIVCSHVMFVICSVDFYLLIDYSCLYIQPCCLLVYWLLTIYCCTWSLYYGWSLNCVIASKYTCRYVDLYHFCTCRLLPIAGACMINVHYYLYIWHD